MAATRKPLALTNWKMAMTIAECLAFFETFEALAGDLTEAVDVVVCPPFTALWAAAQVSRSSHIQLGGQNIAPTDDLARMGEISAALLADVGCTRVMLGHWEVRRYQGDDDAIVNRKVHLALQSGLSPILLVGEGRDEAAAQKVVLENHLTTVLQDCQPAQVEEMAFVYEPEGAIGVQLPASPDQVATGCGMMREWLRRRFGEDVGNGVRIIYGGSVAPEHAAELLAVPDLDGLGATRRGRDPESFVEIVRQIARACSASSRMSG
jgi:triosephosphate isomerase